MPDTELYAWAREALGQGPLVLLLVALYKRKMIFGWQLDESQAACQAATAENIKLVEMMKVSTLTAAEAARTTQQAVDALERARAEFVAKLEELDRQRDDPDRERRKR